MAPAVASMPVRGERVAMLLSVTALDCKRSQVSILGWGLGDLILEGFLL